MSIRFEEWFCLGGTGFSVPTCSKEGDTAFKPMSTQPNLTDWHTLVFESEFSERLTRLRVDAHI